MPAYSSALLVDRRHFLAGAAALTSLAAVGWAGVSSTAHAATTTTVWTLKTDGWSTPRGAHGHTHCHCSACRAHAANKIFATRAAAEDPALRAHPGCLCEPVATEMDTDTHDRIFADGVTIVDRRHTDLSGTTPTSPPSNSPPSTPPPSTSPPPTSPPPTSPAAPLGPPALPKPGTSKPVSHRTITPPAHTHGSSTSPRGGRVNGHPTTGLRSLPTGAAAGSLAGAPNRSSSPQSDPATVPDHGLRTTSAHRHTTTTTDASPSARQTTGQVASTRPRPRQDPLPLAVAVPVIGGATVLGALLWWRRRGDAEPDSLPPADN